jgi:hypothetical protein
MKGKRKIVFCLAAAIRLSLPAKAQEPTAPVAGEGPVLKGILNNTAAYCQKLDDYAYYFVCHEAVTEKLVGQSKVQWSPSTGSGQGFQNTTISVRDTSVTNTYLYEYQLIRKKGENQEKRTLLEKNHKRMAVPNAKLEAMRFYFENFVFGPVDLFGAAGRLRHEYRIVGRDKIQGEKAIIIEARSTAETNDYNPGGKVWVREGDNAILRVEWDQTSMVGYKEVFKAADMVNAIPKFTLVTEYGVEKNGIRFPSRVFLREAYLRTKSRKVRVVSDVTIDYKDYKFFQVDIETR